MTAFKLGNLHAEHYWDSDLLKHYNRKKIGTHPINSLPPVRGGTLKKIGSAPIIRN
jgi:hypothetical protein